MTRPEWLGLPALGVLALGVPAALAVAAGTLGLPHNDDFTFSATAVDYRRTGGFHLGGDEQMVLIGHVFWGQPFLRLFGGGLVGLHLAGLTAAALGLASSFLVLRRLACPRAALLGTACVALLPGYALLAGSFMTDVTAFAGQMACLAFGLAALDRVGRARWVMLALSLAMGVAAFSSRQTAIPALVAVAVAALWQSAACRRQWRTATVDMAFILTGAAAAAAIALWRFGLPGQGPSPSSDVGISNLPAVLAALSTLALFVAPLSWLAARSVLRSARGRCAAALAAISTLAWLWLPLEGRDLLLGNLFTRRGANDGVIGGVKADIFPPLVWPALQVLALLAVLALLTVAWHATTTSRPRLSPARRQEGEVAGLLIAVFTILAIAAAVAPAARGANIFDRYLWTAGAGMVALLLMKVPDEAWRRSPLAGGAVALLGVLAVFTAVSITESIAFDRARWRAGEAAVASGVPANLVDAGYEWTGHHASRPLSRPRPAEVSTAVTWWSRVYSAGLPCVVVMASPLQDARYSLDHKTTYDPPPQPPTAAARLPPVGAVRIRSPAPGKARVGGTPRLVPEGGHFLGAEAVAPTLVYSCRE